MALSEERATSNFADILVHYFRITWQHTDHSWNWENAGEIEDALEGFAQAIESVIADEVDRRINELRGL